MNHIYKRMIKCYYDKLFHLKEILIPVRALCVDCEIQFLFFFFFFFFPPPPSLCPPISDTAATLTSS